MSSLDEKLREILRESAGDWYHDGLVLDPTEDIEGCLAQIKQALADEQRPKIEALMAQMEQIVNDSQKRLDELKQAKAYIWTDKSRAVAEGLMTGQEWLARFEKALKHELYGNCDGKLMCDGCSCDAIKAAKHAAGLGDSHDSE